MIFSLSITFTFTISTLTQFSSSHLLPQDGISARMGSSNSTATNTTTPSSTLPTFGDTVQIHGGMSRTDQTFQDGLTLNILSPKNRTITVTQNTTSLPSQFVTSTTGTSFIALKPYSYILTTNGSATDLIASLSILYSPSTLQSLGIQEANTYVATLSPSKKSWVIDDTTRNVHRASTSTRLLKLTSLDGEYMLLARQSIDTSNIYTEYGPHTLNFTDGPGVQTASYTDDLQFTLQSPLPLSLSVVLNPSINPGTLPANMQSLNSYTWIVTTRSVNTSSPIEKIDAEMRVPLDRAMLAALHPEGSSPSTMLVVARRPLNATSGQFLPVMPAMPAMQVVRELPEDRIQIPGMAQLDRQYVILVTAPKGVGQSKFSEWLGWEEGEC
jgi:hypothetical protein